MTHSNNIDDEIACWDRNLWIWSILDGRLKMIPNLIINQFVKVQTTKIENIIA